jgi:EAL and modified HD-GYP domain-containing signal transduction protein
MTPPLLHVATVRAKLMENLAMMEWPDQPLQQDQAFMVGILSLMDVLFGMPLPEILKEVSLADEVVSALLKHEGRLGRLLMLAENTEGEDRVAVKHALGDLPRLSPTFLAEAQLSAIAWADEIAKA